MLKLFRYLKKAYVPIIAIVLLLILQASCDLTLPTFTSNIVNVGIQQKGIEDAVPDVMREETFLALKSLMKQDATDDKIASHAIWASEILKKYSDFNADNAMEIIRYEVGRVFEQVLEDAGVFKRDKQGKEAFARFVEQLG